MPRNSISNSIAVTARFLFTNTLYLLFAFIPGIGLSQSAQVKFRHITNEDGLSNSTIEAIFQDNKGFMWFGTRDGLNRFDGYEFTVFKHNPADTTSISDNYIRDIYEDSDHTLWIGTSNGLNRFNAKNNTFSRFKTSNGLSNNLITAIHQDRSGKLWIGTYGGGLNVLNLQSGRFTHFKHQQQNKKTISDDRVNNIVEQKNGNLWIATARGLNVYQKASHTFQQPAALQNYTILKITKESDEVFWLATEEAGLIRYNTQTGYIKQYRHQEKQPSSLGSDQVRAIVVDKKGNLWVGGVNGGLNLFNTQTESFLQYQNRPGDPSSLSQRTVSSLFEDKQGNLWIGTHRGGINLHSPGADKFKLIQQEPTKNSLSYNDVKAFYEDRDGNLWIGTDGGGLNFLDRSNNTFRHYRYSPYVLNSIGSDAVLHIMEDSRKNLLIGTWGGGLNLFDRNTGTFTRYLHNSQNTHSISSNYVQKSFEDSHGNIWICTYYGGLNLFDPRTKQFKKILYGSDKKSRLFGNNILAINEDKTGKIWIGTDDGGLNCYDPATGKFSHYFENEEKKPEIRVIFLDSKGRLWLGQTGLYLFEPTKNKFSLVSTQAGLSTEFIKGITEDENGNFWISTSNGLTEFNPRTKSFKKYNTADGLQGLEFEANAYLKTRKGEMFFGGVNGINSFFPKDIKPNRYIPPVYITDFQIFNKKIMPGGKHSPLQSDISLTKKIDLSYDQSTFSFGFAALNYTASENNNYAYKLEGLDDDWVYAGNNHRANYTNLDPGTYTFIVKAANNDGIWNNTGTSIGITITPPFWETWWFRVLILAFISTGAYAAYQFKRKLELKELEEAKREEIHQTQLQFFTNISHEFRTPLSLILGPLEKLTKENPNSSFNHYYTTMYRNAARLMNLINELMDFRKVEAGALKLKVIPGNLSLFIDEIAEEFQELASDKNITFKVKKDENLPEIWFDRHVLEKIIINLINNSLKYTQNGGQVILEILSSLNEFKPSFENHLIIKNPHSAKNDIYIRVADNGTGISKESIHHLFERYYRITESHLGSGVGLAFVKSLTMLHKGNIHVSSEKHKGTEIIISIPTSKDDYDEKERWIKSNEEGGTRLESINYNADLLVSAATETLSPDTSQVLFKHILIVDDNEELRTFLKECLSSSYKISEAEDGYAGIEKAKEISPDLIISDVMMPGMDGIQFCKILKEDIETSHLPFLMLTAKNSVEAEIEGVESGADYYFSKPISINLLLLTIKNIFSQKQRLKDHYSKDQYAEVRDLVHSKKDKDFIDKLLKIIESQLINSELDIEFLCLEMGMSRTKLYQKIKSISGQSIGEFIRTIRLRKAVEIMTQEDVLLTEVMYRVGIQTQSYFTKAFKKEFGKTPSQFLGEIKR